MVAQPKATVATLAVILERLERTTANGFEQIDKHLGNFVLKELYQSERSELGTRVSQLEDTIRWITRLLIGLVITAIVSAVIGVSRGLHP